MPNVDPFSALNDAVGGTEFLADLFLILYFDETTKPTDETPVLHVPQSLHQLLINQSEDSQQLLAGLIYYAREDAKTLTGDELLKLVATLREKYLLFLEREKVRPIADEADSQIRQVVMQLIPEVESEGLEGRVTLRANFLTKMRNTVRKSITTTLSVSKRTGMGILMRGHDFSRLIRDRITQLELPAKHNQFFEKKTQLTSRLFSFKGGKAVKFYVGVGVALGGLVATSLAMPLGIGGLALCFVDP
jgi:hypothetical protein